VKVGGKWSQNVVDLSADVQRSSPRGNWRNEQGMKLEHLYRRYSGTNTGPRNLLCPDRDGV
jgi:hypothetical protein